MIRRNFRRCAALVLALALAAGLRPAGAAQAPKAPAEPAVSARHAVLIDAADAALLFAKAADTQAPMASTTKIMTALLLLEAGDPEVQLTATAEMVTVEGTSMGLRAGDLVTRYTLACGMLLSSGNDAANAAAIHLAGSQQAFALRMNARATQIGMTRTNFITPSGLDTQGHCSTAYDMALLGREALRNALFRGICGQTQIRVSYGNPPYPRVLHNHNRLLSLVEGTVGLKTGYTKKSGRCLVSACTRSGVTLIAVTLNAPNDWEDHRKLYDYGFACYETYPLDEAGSTFALPVTGGKTTTARLGFLMAPTALLRASPKNLRRQLLLRPFEYAPLPQGRVAGTVRYYDGNTLLAEVPLTVLSTVEVRPAAPTPVKKGLWAKIRERLNKS
ncbi:MAG: D-alanyl-D-alanine carboxypeptidase [Oscillospiraceae bacterium]|jgi:D-alanyl-D-alanine carboxypeptidase/D-alanyl-D-alanine carboxypeptidase (penicillin-binding protein 5/6)|nr:D-alanyl-D-alanine carboxypeptidase [Oscillospiraceae bacterium]